MFMKFEIRLIQFLQAGANDGWTIFFKMFSLMGSWLGVVLVFFAISLKSLKTACAFLGTYLFAIGSQYLLKILIAKERPYLVDSSISKLTDALGNSTPSGHSISAMVIGVFATVAVWKFVSKRYIKISTLIIAILFIGMVGVSRMYLGVHFLSDVLVGFAYGLTVAFLGMILFKLMFSSKWWEKLEKRVKESAFVKRLKHKIVFNKETNLNQEYVSKSKEETIAFAKKLIRKIKKPCIMVLEGDLGAGKTHFVKGLSTGLGSKSQVTSPTFTLLNTYKGRKFNLNHFDMYRLNESAEAFDLGFEEFFENDKLQEYTVVEWAEKTPNLLKKPYIKIKITKLKEENSRKIVVKEEKC